MKRDTKTWLLSFTDLSFLLLIALSLIPSSPIDVTVHLAEMDLPAVPDSSAIDKVSPTPDNRRHEAWELQVRPLEEGGDTPFRLVQAVVDENRVVEKYVMDVPPGDLEETLLSLRRKSHKPVIVAESRSLSGDFLFAQGTLTKVWAQGGGKAVVRVLEEDGDE